MLYVLGVLTGLFAQGFVSERLVVSGDAVASATNILTHKSLFELGFTVYMIEMACQVAITALFYDLLKPVSKSVALVSLCLGLVGCTIKITVTFSTPTGIITSVQRGSLTARLFSRIRQQRVFTPGNQRVGRFASPHNGPSESQQQRTELVIFFRPLVLLLFAVDVVITLIFGGRGGA